MKKPLIALTLVAATAAVVTLCPIMDSDAGTPPATPPEQISVPRLPLVTPEQRPRIEVVFALDTTGSMDGLIAAAKEKIWSIASTMASAQPAPEIRIGLVAYRDRGDAYVTRVVDLSADLDSMYAKLMDFRAEGGGDGPESVNQALSDAVERINWSADAKTYKVVFLVGDAPPHMDYQGETRYPQIVAAARAKGIVVNTIQCGQDAQTQGEWQRIAALSQGSFFNVAQDGAAVAIATPFDDELARLSAQLDRTRLYFGSARQQARQAEKVAATEKLHARATPATRARRAAFNASVSGADNFLGEQELVDAVSKGRVDVATLAPEALPEPLRAMAPAARAAAVKDKAEARRALESRISAMAKERDEYLAAEVAATGGARDSLDDKLLETVREQAAGAGMKFIGPAKY